MGAKQQNRWSAAVTHGSNALDLENGVFKKIVRDKSRFH
jgi:hypothetical protein